SSVAGTERLVVIVVANAASAEELAEVAPLACRDEFAQRKVDELAFRLDRRIPQRLLHQLVVQHDVGPHAYTSKAYRNVFQEWRKCGTRASGRARAPTPIPPASGSPR